MQLMALRVGPKLVFGDTPYGQSASGTTESISALTPSDDVPASTPPTMGPTTPRWCWPATSRRPQAEKLARQVLRQLDQQGCGTGGHSALRAGASGHACRHRRQARRTAVRAVRLRRRRSRQLARCRSPERAQLHPRRQLRQPHQHEPPRGARLHLRRALRLHRAIGTAAPSYAGGLVRTDVTAAAAKELMKEIQRLPVEPFNRAKSWPQPRRP